MAAAAAALLGGADGVCSSDPRFYDLSGCGSRRCIVVGGAAPAAVQSMGEGASSRVILDTDHYHMRGNSDRRLAAWRRMQPYLWVIGAPMSAAATPTSTTSSVHGRLSWTNVGDVGAAAVAAVHATGEAAPTGALPAANWLLSGSSTRDSSALQQWAITGGQQRGWLWHACAEGCDGWLTGGNSLTERPRLAIQGILQF